MKTKEQTMTVFAMALLAGFAMALALGSIGVGLVHADPPTAPASLAQGNTVSGSVTNIDTVNNTIQVKDNSGQIQTLLINQSVQIARNNQPVTINDLKVDDVVTVTSSGH